MIALMIAKKDAIILEQGSIRIWSLGLVRAVLGHLDATWRSPECIDAVVSCGGDSSGIVAEANNRVGRRRLQLYLQRPYQSPSLILA